LSQAAAGALPDPPAALPRLCERCGAVLRAANLEVLCDPCAATVASCAPWADQGTCHDLAPEGVNLVELVAGLMLTHDALHPGEKLYLREALAEYGVEVDHVQVWQVVSKLKRRHRLVITGEPRQPGYAVEDWLWTARRTRSSVADRTALTADNQRETGNAGAPQASAPTLFQAQSCTE
jgi:hypothetical protein